MNWETILFLIGSAVIIPIFTWCWTKWVSNEKLDTWGESWGKKLSAKASNNLFGKSTWEIIEDKFLGGLIVLVTAIKRGADLDDTNGSGKAGSAVIKMLLIGAVILGFSVGPAMAQDNEAKLVPEVLLGFSKFTFDGDYALNVGGAAIGVKYQGHVAEPGLFLYSKIFKDESTDNPEVSLDAIFHVAIWDKYGAGIGVEFWQSGIGFVKDFGGSNAYLTLTYNLEL